MSDWQEFNERVQERRAMNSNYDIQGQQLGSATLSQLGWQQLGQELDTLASLRERLAKLRDVLEKRLHKAEESQIAATQHTNAVARELSEVDAMLAGGSPEES